MTARLPSASEIIAVLNLPVSGRHRILEDKDPDPGLFGPGSVTWQVMAEPLLVMGGIRAVLMQVAEPRVAAGVRQHSIFSEDPFGRLLRVYDWTMAVAFGTRREAMAACRGINRKHQAVEGTVAQPDATASLPAGSDYRAHDATLSRWVHGTLVDTLLVTYEALVGPLSVADGDRFVREWNAVARLVGVRQDQLFWSRDDLRRYIAVTIEEHTEVSESGTAIADTLLHGPFSATRRIWPAMTLISVELSPTSLRRQFGITHGAAETAAARALIRGVRLSRALLPPRLRSSSVAQQARRRCSESRGPGRAVA